ncbi:MAG: L,D-transpeptidase family protein [Chthoniobacter sp.]|uniref:L,D-transpeptidase family protein n=1 Tax=Chthoniobacter sp. TaxID=2510640 RepID=UPI0032A24435
MSKVSPALLAATVSAALWLLGTHAPAEPVTDPASSTPDSIDRVAAARVQHEAAIRQKYHAAAVQYPGEIFLRWLKREAVVELWARNGGGRFRLVFRYSLLAVSGVPGPKRREGDKQVPEGFYEIDRFNPKSLFHLSLGLNYPNAADRVLSDREHPGGDIFIHGGNVTIGCAPLGDEAIEEVYLAALGAHEQGQTRIQVHIFPDRMSGPEWEQYAASEIARRPELAAFWAQLRPGFEYFERRRVLPAITVTEDGRYILGD